MARDKGKRCPKCNRNGVFHEEDTDIEICTWRDCLWENTDNIDLDKHDYGIVNKKFVESVK